MVDILRGLGTSVLSVGAQICDQPTFGQIDQDRSTIPYKCNERRFPAFLGTSGTATTDIYNFEINTLGDIGVAGTSNDMTLVSVSGAHFVGIYKYPGFNFTWVD